MSDEKKLQEEKAIQGQELQEEELDEVSGGTGARELGEKGIQPENASGHPVCRGF